MTETFVDSKKDVDSQLKRACEDFISNVTDQLIGPLRMFLSKVSGQSVYIFFHVEIHLLKWKYPILNTYRTVTTAC